VIWLRSLLFQGVFYAWTTLVAVYSLVPMALNRRAHVFAMNAFWARSLNVLLRVICGIHVRIEGREHIPAGPVLVASKHQSLWDTAIIFDLFGTPAVVMKMELLRIPIYGWLTRIQGMIAVDRDGGASALKQMLKDARAARDAGRKIVIFPQGTRTRPGEVAEYQSGVMALYRDLKLPVLPIALNSGMFWPKKGLLRPPGTLILRFLPPIPPGLDRETFMAELERRIETATAELEAAARPH
jgi:1-acyl-sn-glycerol-3-phosphate acyltransferase